MKLDSNDELEVARAVLRYLHQHPDAKDTLEGIAQWWLLRECTERKLAEVERGVSILLEQGLLIEVRREGLMPFYRLNQDQEEGAEAVPNAEAET